ncbi:hypothetical protein [Parasitella parasitica]|uniref:Uncharacterized protein n=1 Tax=Parasitella parasitica TaxID=35722 RepID=A0A0B7NER3_9FUNG|nr:hypothetical protein [Parasitella parasitica]
MQIEAKNGDASMAAMAPNNEGGELYTLDTNSNWDDESDNDSASMPYFHELPDNLLNVKYKTLGIVDDNVVPGNLKNQSEVMPHQEEA